MFMCVMPPCNQAGDFVSIRVLLYIDVELAYCLIPDVPDDRALQAMVWDSEHSVDPMLPFSLRFTPIPWQTLWSGICVRG